MAKTYTVSVAFSDMKANDPLHAAKTACDWLLEDNDANGMVYDVTDETTGEKFTVDLSEEDDDAVLPNNPIKPTDELLDKVVEQIIKDYNTGDTTAIYELLKKVPTENLESFLPE